jgi:hypothetical protein
MNPFQGQYPNRLVRRNATPINPSTHRKLPGVKEAKIIKMTPRTDRKIPSPLPTFLIFPNDSISSSLRIKMKIKIKNPMSRLRNGFKISIPHLPSGQGDWRTNFWGNNSRREKDVNTQANCLKGTK